MIEFAACTHPGKRYQHNEDAIGWNERSSLWFVADGMGGHARGDIASATVKKALLSAASDHQRSLTELTMLAHEAVLLEGIERSLPNMGSTLVLARVSGNRLNIAWCGDSRAYLWRDGELIRLTRDHSLLEQLLESGVVSPDEAFDHPRRNVLVQALGINDPRPVPSEIRIHLDNDDLLLLCSDGIHDELHDTTIAEILAAVGAGRSVGSATRAPATTTAAVATTAKAVVDELERRVLATDARDNLSVICLQASALEPSSDGPLDVAQVKRELAATQSNQPTQRTVTATRKKLADTLELPEVTNATQPTQATTAVAGPRKPAITPRDSRSGSQPLASDSNFELWVALACIALLVVLVLLFT